MTRTYEWTQAALEVAAPLGHPPPWWTVSAATHPLSLASPASGDWTLERIEAYAQTGWTVINNPIGPIDPTQFIAPSTRILAEVYPFGSSSFPDPSTSGTQRAVWSAGLTVDAVWRDPAEQAQGIVMWSTKGLVLSKGRRGPSDYGGGRCQINFGVWTANCFNTLFPGVFDSMFVLSARALWSHA